MALKSNGDVTHLLPNHLLAFHVLQNDHQTNLTLLVDMADFDKID